MLENKSNSGLLTMLAANWQAEMEDHATYQAFAAKESNARRRNAMRGFAATEQHHADLWAARIYALGGSTSIYNGNTAGRAGSFLDKQGAIDLALRSLRRDARHKIVRYHDQLTELSDEPSLVILREVIADENEHYQVLSSLIRARPPLPKMENDQARQVLASLMAARQSKDPAAASWANDAIYAANDGLGSIFGIVSGVAGATFGKSRFVLIAGLAGMIGSALTTGTSAYLSAKSQRELFDAGVLRERKAVDYNPAEAREVLALNLQIRGLPEDVAIRLVHLLAENKEEFIKTLARMQSNMSEENLSIPSVAALVGAVATATGAFLPIIPFFFMTGIPAIMFAGVISLLAHFLVGAARSSMTVRAWWSTGLELTAFGAAEGILTFSLGMALGQINLHI